MMGELLINPELKRTLIFETFEESAYGEKLNNNTRFNDFKPEWLENSTWEVLLGDDVNNLRHMTHTRKLTEKFCAYNYIDKDTTDKLLLTAQTHDFGEAIIGDIAQPSKTEEDEAQEEIAYRYIVTDLYGTMGDEIADTVWSVLKHTDKEAGDMFRAVEYLGYCTTGMRAGYIAQALAEGFINLGIPRVQQTQLIGGLLSMEKALQVHSYPTLKAYVAKYPGIEAIIREGV